MRALKAGVAYFAFVFVAGFVLGVVRVIFIAPHLGARTAELAEMPVMLIIVALAARWVVRKFALPAARMARLRVGLIALALLIALEFSVVLWVRGVSLSRYFAELDPIAGTVYYLLLLVFAAMPALMPRR